MAFVFYRNLRRPNEASVTIAGSELAIRAAVERVQREGNEVTAIMPPNNLILEGKNPPKRAPLR
jgi:hypothetical protein